MKHKIFISINLSEKVRKRLILTCEKWQNLPIKWVPIANLHITLAYLGWIYDEALADICQKVREIVSQYDMLDLEFEKITLAPENKKPNMVWFKGKNNPEIMDIVNSLEKELDISRAPRKTFSPHITLGRIRTSKWEALAEKPSIDENFHILVPVESIEIMASDFREEGSEYSVIETCPLN
jgi:2'-5' RNA ligase